MSLSIRRAVILGLTVIVASCGESGDGGGDDKAPTVLGTYETQSITYTPAVIDDAFVDDNNCGRAPTFYPTIEAAGGETYGGNAGLPYFRFSDELGQVEQDDVLFFPCPSADECEQHVSYPFEATDDAKTLETVEYDSQAVLPNDILHPDGGDQVYCDYWKLHRKAELADAVVTVTFDSSAIRKAVESEAACKDEDASALDAELTCQASAVVTGSRRTD